MPRNTEKDTLEEARRRKQILEAGFHLFSQQGIENVSMNAVAKAAEVGSTTLFKYYQTKENLVIAISGMVWSRVWQNVLAQMGAAQFAQFTALDLIRLYTDTIVELYQRQPSLLCFSGDYKTFICRQKTQADALREHLDPLQPIQTLFHVAYQRAQTDHSIRTDVPESVLFTGIAIGMLSIAERYAQGIVWTSSGNSEHLQELKMMQDMILLWCKATHP